MLLRPGGRLASRRRRSRVVYPYNYRASTFRDNVDCTTGLLGTVDDSVDYVADNPVVDATVDFAQGRSRCRQFARFH